MSRPTLLGVILVLLFTLLSAGAHAQEEPNHAEHEALRALLGGLESAINEERYADLARYFHANMRVTTINQEVLSSPDGIAAYFDYWFGPDGYLSKLHIKLIADDLTEFYGDGSIGVVRGRGEEDYILADGRSFDMVTRWTATVIRDEEGAWRILTLHIGTNFLDNPILAMAEGALGEATLFGVALGGSAVLLLAFIVYRVRRRKPD